ncbi:MAG: 4-(cytidine 5'-diphospho)-2-C-methyl-D-erythritol kinase [Acidimicrobiales bacterium]|nr:4-(cytidine 5'-diphospho)-2-C-methyl-D-erythritol kinase [Acidimicrobiales bacterium]
MTAVAPVFLTAPAKLTLNLRITGVLDNGYHLIDAEMVTVDLHDTLWLDPGGEGLVVRDGGVDLAADENNLVAKALSLTGRTAAITLTKRIPSQAGLGGGSADAGAVLRWAGFTDLEKAAQIGADVAFCTVGGRARVTGIGQLVEPLPFVARDLTLFTPPVGCPTPVIYSRWDAMGGAEGDNGNDLEPAAIAAVPELARYRDHLGEISGQTPRLAGSGSTWFVEGHHAGEGLVLVKTVPAGWSAYY